ncbi:MAG TPA: thiol reductant ABC exporter subunit CydC [Candidatus Ornithoclostridium excrementipullorum]|nr:thiol reductant ABC exporter subunit CydC [Candidatus Ornithoclostridium excrementipullorum]
MKKNNAERAGGAKIMARLIVLLGSLAYIMVFAVVNGSLGFISAMGVTLFGAIGIAKALGEQIAMSYGLIIGLAVGCGVLRGLLRYAEQYCNHYIAFRLLAVLRDKIFGALRVLCPAKLESKRKGAIIAMITSDIETLEVFYAHTISPICIAAVVSTAVFLFVGFASSWYLALAALVGYFAIGVVLPVISSSLLRSGGVGYRKEFSSFNAYFLDSIKGVKDIVLNNAEKERLAEVDRRSDVLLDYTKKIKRKTATAAGITEIFVSVFIILTLIVGIVLVSAGALSIGKMIIGVVAVFGSFGPVIAISALPGNLTQTFASGDRVLKLLAEKPAVEPVTDGTDMDFHRVETKDLCFSYERDKRVLNEVCMHAEAGEIVGIVGASGCGKSTLLKLLMRFWEKDSGSIEYDGTDVDRINSDSLTDNVAMVSQSTYLFDESIADNLRIAKYDATDEELKEACRKASVHEFIESLPDGYDTKVGALGDNLSAGEKQRIGLARAFLHDGRLILLDEPTSNVDSINEGIILKALKDCRSDKAIILVSHRESTMAIADRVYKIEKGVMTDERRKG